MPPVSNIPTTPPSKVSVPHNDPPAKFPLPKGPFRVVRDRRGSSPTPDFPASVRRSRRQNHGVTHDIVPLDDYPASPRSDDHPIPVSDILRCAPPIPAPIYDPNALTGTRLPTGTEIESPASSRLEQVVLFHPLISQLEQLADQLLQDIWVDPGSIPEHVWMTSVHPAYTSRHLPVETRSEHDTEDWVFNVYLRPSTALLKLLDTKSIANKPKRKYPNVSSAGGQSSIPDGILTVEVGLAQEVKASFEIKTHNAMPGAGRSDNKRPAFRDIMHHWNAMPLGRAVKFNWPESLDLVSSLQIEAKLLIQVWQQMQHKEVDYAMLSSFQTTFFFVKEGNTLFMSPGYERQNRPLQAVFAFMALAVGRIPRRELYLPAVDTEWWPATVHRIPGRIGLDSMTLPHVYLGEICPCTLEEAWIA